MTKMNTTGINQLVKKLSESVVSASYIKPELFEK